MIAERLLLLDVRPTAQISDLTSINYAQPRSKSPTATESGKIHLKRGSHDLMTATQLSQWAIREADTEWQLTIESVAAALKPGRKVNEMLTLLKERLSHPILPLLEIALRSLGG